MSQMLVASLQQTVLMCLDNRQILKSAKQGMDHLDKHDFRGTATAAGSSQNIVTDDLQITADGAHVAAVQ